MIFDQLINLHALFPPQKKVFFIFTIINLAQYTIKISKQLNLP